MAASPIGNYFVALPAEVSGSWYESLQAKAPPALRWFHRQDLHVTIAFLGREDQERIPPLLDVIERIAFPGAEATLNGLRLLPGRRRFTALSFELDEGREEIEQLIATWRPPLLEVAGRPPDNRSPLAHLTVARPDRRGDRFDARKIAEWALAQGGSRGSFVRLSAPTLLGWGLAYHSSPETEKPRFRVISKDG